MGLELIAPRSRVACSTVWASQMPQKYLLSDGNSSRSQRCKGLIPQSWLPPLQYASLSGPEWKNHLFSFPARCTHGVVWPSFLFFTGHHAVGVAKTILILYEALPSFGLSTTSSKLHTGQYYLECFSGSAESLAHRRFWVTTFKTSEMLKVN